MDYLCSFSHNYPIDLIKLDLYLNSNKLERIRGIYMAEFI